MQGLPESVGDTRENSDKSWRAGQRSSGSRLMHTYFLPLSVNGKIKRTNGKHFKQQRIKRQKWKFPSFTVSPKPR